MRHQCLRGISQRTRNGDDTSIFDSTILVCHIAADNLIQSPSQAVLIGLIFEGRMQGLISMTVVIEIVCRAPGSYSPKAASTSAFVGS